MSCRSAIQPRVTLKLMKIEFKAKAKPSLWYDSNFNKCVSDSTVAIPAIKRHHCTDEGTTRCDQYSNSNLCAAMVQRELETRGMTKRIDLNNLPEGVTVSGNFMKTITITNI